jgi:hypothetical protein
MSTRLYVMPYESSTANGRTFRGPKYIPGTWDSDPSDNVAVTAWGGVSYGLFNWGIVAVEADAAGHTALAAKADVQQMPANLDTNVGNANRVTVQNFLESASLPGQWVTNGTLWREVVRTVCGFMLFGQRFDGLNPGSQPLGTLLQGKLSTQWQNIPADLQSAFVATAQSLGYDTSAIQPTTTVRAILKTMADAWGTQPVYFGLENFNGGAPFTV